MSKKLNTTEKKLKFYCSVCFTVYQLQEVKQSLKISKETRCLNNCSKKWKDLLVEYCQEQIILDLTRKEQQKEEQDKELANQLEKIRKQNAQK
jgi:hypothetical protein